MGIIKRFAMSLYNQAPAFLFNRLRLLLLLSASIRLIGALTLVATLWLILGQLL